jgi:hypothetical protein
VLGDIERPGVELRAKSRTPLESPLLFKGGPFEETTENVEPPGKGTALPWRLDILCR